MFNPPSVNRSAELKKRFKKRFKKVVLFALLSPAASHCLLIVYSIFSYLQTVSMTTVENETALDLAIENGHVETVQLLLKYGRPIM